MSTILKNILTFDSPTIHLGQSVVKKYISNLEIPASRINLLYYRENSSETFDLYYNTRPIAHLNCSEAAAIQLLEQIKVWVSIGSFANDLVVIRNSPSNLGLIIEQYTSNRCSSLVDTHKIHFQDL